jgi:hypothetical protein
VQPSRLGRTANPWQSRRRRESPPAFPHYIRLGGKRWHKIDPILQCTFGLLLERVPNLPSVQCSCGFITFLPSFFSTIGFIITHKVAMPTVKALISRVRKNLFFVIFSFQISETPSAKLLQAGCCGGWGYPVQPNQRPVMNTHVLTLIMVLGIHIFNS